jgi:hypothetical protein
MPLIIENSPSQIDSTRRRILVSTVSLLVSQAWAGESLEVMHQGPESPGDKRDEYYWLLLDTALRRTAKRWGPYQIHSATTMNGLRAIQQLQSANLDIVARTTNQKLEISLRPIRIPLDKGLLGYRVFLIRRDMQERLDRVHSLDDLKQFSIGQVQYWDDVTILRNSGFKVAAADRYEGLFPMLSAGRFDLLGRSVAEVAIELQTRQQQFPDLVIEQGLLLYYPLPRYLFVRRDFYGEQLALRIEDGFNLMINDGSFDRMFKVHSAPFEKILNLSARRLFRIPNPLLPAETPLNKSKLWYVPNYLGRRSKRTI